MKYKLKITYLCDKGKKREINEDSIMIGKQVYQNTGETTIAVENTDYFHCAVCDGMGGYQGGDIASTLILNKLKDQKINNENMLEQLLFDCKASLEQLSEDRKITKKMGAVLAGLVITDHDLFCYNLGDSRVYRISDGKLNRVSRDHSYVEQLYENGEITYDQMRTHPKKNIVTSGITNDTDDDMELFSIRISDKASLEFLLCSDGLWEMLSDEEIQNRLTKDKPVQSLYEEAMNGGGSDNISIIYIKAQKIN